MQQELKEQFDYITNPKATQFDPLFVICTFFIPAYLDVLDEDQITAAKTQLNNWMTPHLSLCQPHEQSTELTQSHQPTPTTITVDNEPPSNRFKHIKELLTEKRREFVSTWK